jgi:hypothetical protein
MREKLVEQFKKVGLVLKITDEPIGRTTNDDIFQMDVGRKVNGTRRTEWFEIWPGHVENKIQILDIDHKLNQLLLMVHEPEREFETEEKKQTGKWATKPERRREQLAEQRGIKVRETETHFIITEKTLSTVRHFLMGVDERQLFVAQLTEGVTNINVARSLLGNTVRFHEGVRKMSPKRQGEWFFLKATQKQEDLIELFIQKNKTWIIKKASIGQYAGRNSGNPHTADELVMISHDQEEIERLGMTKWAKKRNPRRAGIPIRLNHCYVRGAIRHIDHKTIKYSHWYQVVLNNEGDTASATQSWID